MQNGPDTFELLVRELQQRSFAEAREAFGERGFDRWRYPRFNGPLPDADCSGRLKGSCGDTIEIFLKFAGNRVAKASYVTDGCASSMLCGSFTAELAHGRTPDELLEIEPEDVLGAIGTFPKKEEHCATLATLALQEAVNNYMLGCLSARS